MSSIIAPATSLVSPATSTVSPATSIVSPATSIVSAPPGCPVSSQATNLLTAPNDLANAAWTVSGTLTVNDNQIVDPCGAGTDAAQILDTATNGVHQVFQAVTVASSGGTATSSLFVKQSTGRYIVLAIGRDGSNFLWVNVDTQTGTITQASSAGGGSLTNDTIQSCGNGWYYVTITGSITGTTSYFCVISLSNSATPGTDSPSYAGTGTGVYVYQARLSNGSL